MINSFRGKHSFLSNFHPCIILYANMEFGSVEAAYQAMKTLDLEERKAFLHVDAKTAKRMGNELKRTGKVRKDWHSVKLAIMFELLIIKFRDPILKELLLATGNTELIEMNTWHDEFWGICICSNHGKGKNHLGIWLMNVREYYLNFDE